MKKRKLTPKQKRFVEEYLVDLNATQAAIRAGYSQKTARKIGQENLTKPDIQNEIQKAMDKRSERTEITADMVVEQLAKIGFADIKDVVTWGEKEYTLGFNKKKGEAIKARGIVLEVRPSDEVDGTILSEISETQNHQGKKVVVKLSDRMRALELLGRHLGMFKDNVRIDGNIGVQFVDDIGSDEDDAN